MSKKAVSTIKRETIEYRFPMTKGISECDTLGDIKELVEALIAEHGSGGRVNFDAGHNNISEEIVVSRQETDEELNRRIDKEIETILLKQVAQDIHLNTKLQSLMAAKSAIK